MANLAILFLPVYFHIFSQADYFRVHCCCDDSAIQHGRVMEDTGFLFLQAMTYAVLRIERLHVQYIIALIGNC